MKYYTKEWYELMQNLHYVSGMTVVPDKEYTDAEIQAFYDADLAAEIEHDRRIYEERQMPFDPAETIQCFEECYRALRRYGLKQYPSWARESIDRRLYALNRMPESAYNRLLELENVNQAAFEQINQKARAVLEQQDIPAEIRSKFCFHDAAILSLRRKGKDAELLLRKDGGWMEPMTPYIKIIFKNVSLLEREGGFMPRPRKADDGTYSSNYAYLYDELYRVGEEYEVHILLWSLRGLRYLTIRCEDIRFEDNIETV